MPRSLPPLTSLRAFEAASRSLSFTKAAHELHVTPAAISHQIRGLEQFLGVTLFQRAGRRLELTDHGHLAAEHFREAFDRIARGVQALRPQTRAGELSIGVTPSFATRWLLPRLSSLMTAMPDVTLRFKTGTAPVDFDRDEVDVAVRFGRGVFDAVITDELFGEVMAPLASPEFLRRSPLQRPVDLANVPLIHDDSLRRAARPLTWSEWLRAAGAPALDMNRGLRFDDSHLALQAAVDGQGVALGRLAYACNDLAQGRLVLPYRKTIALDLHYHLLVPETRIDEPLVAAFRAWLALEAEEFRNLLSRHVSAARAA
jgi:LysR family transcriptional regulator, glycine cleavage system transcriptional activator